MSDEPEEAPPELAASAAERALEKANEFRMHAELAAVFEGCRKFDAHVRPGLDAEIAREVQRGVAKLDKAKVPNTPVILPESADLAAEVLAMPEKRGLSTNDYHVHRRPGEAMVIRWLAGDEVETFYDRLQAHFDAALHSFRDEERSANEWKADDKQKAFLAALDIMDVKMPERYLREPIRQHNLFVISTVTADEINILFLTDHIMQVDVAELVGRQSAPPDPPSEKDLAWFFKLFLLRGVVEGVERMCFFTFLQKADDSEW